MGKVIVAAVFVIAIIAGPQIVSDAARSQVEQALSHARRERRDQQADRLSGLSRKPRSRRTPCKSRSRPCG